MRLRLGLLAVAMMSGSAAHGLDRCSDWKPGHEAALERVITIDAIAYPDVRKPLPGTTLIGGRIVEGKFKIEKTEFRKDPTSPDDYPTTPLALFGLPDGRVAFLVPSHGGATFKRKGGMEQPAMSGVLDIGSRKLRFRELRDPFQCVRLDGLNLMTPDRAREVHGAEPRHEGGVRVITEAPIDDTPNLAELFGDGGAEPAVRDPGLTPDIKELFKPAPSPSDGLGGIANPGASESEGLTRLAESARPRAAADEAAAAAAAPEPAPDPEPVAQNICPVDGLSPIGQAVLPDAPLVLVGRVGNATSLPAFEFNEVVTEFYATDAVMNLGAEKGAFVPFVAPFGVFPVVTSDGVSFVPAKMSGALEVAGAEPPPDLDPIINVMVIGDSAAIAKSGLEALETEVAAKTGGVLWQTEWQEITPSGALAARGRFATLSRLVEVAREEDREMLLSTGAQMENFAASLQARLASSEEPFDMVYWVTKGHQYPSNTPLVLETLFKNVAASDGVRRDNDGRSIKKWLQVIAGYFTQRFSLSYLEGPVNSAEPSAGYVYEQDPGDPDAADRYLTDLDLAAVRLRGTVTERARSLDMEMDMGGGGAPTAIPDADFVDAALMFDEVGVVIDGAQVSALLEGLLITEQVYSSLASGASPDAIRAASDLFDMSVLLDPRTDDQAVPNRFAIDPAHMQRRLKRLGLTADGEVLTTHLEDIQQLLVGIRLQAENPNCQKYFVRSDLFRPSWP